MNKITLLLCLIISFSGFAQAELEPGTRSGKAHRSVKDGYTTNLGWELKEGDTLQLGIGSRDRQSFSYIYSSPASFAQIMDANQEITYLDNDYNNRIAVIKKFGAKGRKKIGYKAYAVVGIGEFENYWVEIEDAIEYGELIPPSSEYAPEEEVMEVKVVGQQTDKYDKLAKLKNLLDEGVLTKEEFKTEKKKILDL
jgi:hypothetical protein